MKTMRNLKVLGLAMVFCAASGVLPSQEKDAEASQCASNGALRVQEKGNDVAQNDIVDKTKTVVS